MGEKEKATPENTPLYTIKNIHMITKLSEDQIKHLIRIGLAGSELVDVQVGQGSLSRTIKIRKFNHSGLEACIKAGLLRDYYSPLDLIRFLNAEYTTMDEVIEIAKRKREESSLWRLYKKYINSP